MKKYTTNIINKCYLKENTIKEKKLKNIGKNVIIIYPNEIITDYLGMGGAITESASYNYSKLSKESKIDFINDYYSKDGLNYSWARLSIGTNDFNLKHHEYTKNIDLSDFNIENDKKYIIPLLNDIKEKKELTYIASPWSPPKILTNLFKLPKKNYDIYKNYLLKWIDEYKKNDININYITMQNEPFAIQRWESCLFSLNEQKDFIYNYLAPATSNTKILLWDHNKENLYNNFNYLYENNPQIAGIGFHYYTGSHFNNLKLIRKNNPNILMINTEMCCGYSPYNEKEWVKDAERYANDIIGDFNSGVNAYLDWNILLDKKGGPTHSKNYVKSPIIRNDDNYIKTPIYYYLYHISHFIDINYKIINWSSYTDNLKIVAFKNNNQITITILNIWNKDYDINLIISDKYIKDNIKAHSIITYIYN